MHSIINLKIWKKYIKRFNKKKLKHGDSSCSKISHTQNFIPVPEHDDLCKTKSFEQLSLYSTDSLEDKKNFLKKYGSKRSYNKESGSLDSFITNSVKSDISEDSLQRGSLSKEILYQPMKEHIRIIHDSTESLNRRAGFSNQVFPSKYQIRNRSQTVGQSYQIEKMFKRRSQTFFNDYQFKNHNKIPLNYETQLSHLETVSIDSLDNLLTGRIRLLKKQSISEDSLNEEKQGYFDELGNAYRKKSISDGLLHETRYFQHLLCNRDFALLNRILSNEIKSQDNIEKRQIKSNQCQTHLISLIELQHIEKYKSCKPFPINIPFFIRNTNENYESEDEKISIDSLSIPQSELRRNRSFNMKEKSLKRNKSFSSNTYGYEYCINENSERFNCSPRRVIHHNESTKSDTNKYYHFAILDRKCNLNAQDYKKSSNNNQCAYMDNEKEDSISIDSLCDSLN